MASTCPPETPALFGGVSVFLVGVRWGEGVPWVCRTPTANAPAGMDDVGREWAGILDGLSEKRSSINAAATFALDKPAQATELFARAYGHLEVRASSLHGPCAPRARVC